MYKNRKKFIEKRIVLVSIWYVSRHDRWSVVRIMKKKAKREPEYQYKWKAIIDIGRRQVSRVLCCLYEYIPLYSPDLAPSDFYLLRHLKKHLKGTCYSSDVEMQTAVSHFFHFLSREFCETGARMPNWPHWHRTPLPRINGPALWQGGTL